MLRFQNLCKKFTATILSIGIILGYFHLAQPIHAAGTNTGDIYHDSFNLTSNAITQGADPNDFQTDANSIQNQPLHFIIYEAGSVVPYFSSQNINPPARLNPLQGLPYNTYEIQYYIGAGESTLADNNLKVSAVTEASGETTTGGSPSVSLSTYKPGERIQIVIDHTFDYHLNPVTFDQKDTISMVGFNIGGDAEAVLAGFDIQKLHWIIKDSNGTNVLTIAPYTNINGSTVLSLPETPPYANLTNGNYTINLEYKDGSGIYQDISTQGFTYDSSNLTGNTISASSSLNQITLNTSNASNFSIDVTGFYITPVTPQIQFSSTASSGNEQSSGTQNITLSVSNVSAQSSSVNYTVTGTATSGSDYTLSNGIATIPAMSSSVTIPLVINDDALDEEDSETVILTISNPSKATLGSNTVHTFTIYDDDASPSISFTNASSSQVEDSGGGSATIELSLSAVSGRSISVDYSIDAASTATGSGTDYTLASGTATISAGSSTTTIPLNIATDTLDEDDETIIVNITNPSNSSLGTIVQHTLTITDDDSPVTVEFSSSTSTNDESVTTADIEVILSNGSGTKTASGKSVTVDYFTMAGGTATFTDDYTLSPATLTFSPGETTKNISITIVDDAIAETPDETILLKIANNTNANLGTSDHTYTIVDNDIQNLLVQFSKSAQSSSAETGTESIDVVLSTTSNQTVTVDYAISGGTASQSVDYTLTNGTLTFSAGDTSKNISIPILSDTLDEDDETVILTLSNPSIATLGTNTTHTLTITDDDAQPNVEFSSSTSSPNENGGTHTITISLSAASAKTVTIDTADALTGTATSGTDYNTFANGTVTFNPGETSKTVSLEIIDDALIDPSETIILNLLNPVNSSLGTNTTHTATIQDDETAPTVAFTLTSSSGAESSASPTLEVTLSASSTQTVTVDYAASGTATGSGTDYTLSGTTLTFAPGVTTQDIPISVIEDTLDENDETIIVTLSNPTNSTLGTNTTHTYTITDNDSQPTIAFTSTTQNGAEGTTAVNIPISLSTASGLDTTVDYSVTGGTASGGGVDFLLASGTATITAGNTDTNINLTLSDDSLDEEDETIIITLSNPTNSTLGSNTTNTFTINDDDAAPTIAFTSTSSSGLESVSAVSITVDLSTASGKTITVDFSTGGTATGSGTDYTMTSSSPLTISAGSTQATIDLTVVEDLIAENDETIVLTASNPTNATLGTNTVHTYTINDNDGPNTVQFTLSSSTVDENVTTTTVEVSLNSTSGSTVTVDFALTGTATGSGTDYSTATISPLSFSPGTTTQDISFTIVDDSIQESDETIIITLSNPTNISLGTNTTHTMTITDNDSIPTVGFSTTTSSNTEATTSVSIPVTLSNSSSNTITVDYALTGTASGNGTDYTNTTSSPLSFASGVTTQSIDFTIVSDSIQDGSETIIITLSNPSNATLGTNTTHTYTITDDDNTPTISFNSANVLYEGTTPGTITLDLSSALTLGATIDFAVTGGTATENTDYTLVSASPLTIASGSSSATIQLTITDDADIEGNETIEITLSNPINTLLGTAVGTTTLTDNDNNPGITVNPTSGLITSENGTNAQFTIVLDSQPTADVLINMSSNDTTEGSISPSTLTFTNSNWSVAQAITISGQNDDDADGDQQYTIIIDPAISTDTNYNNIDPANVVVTNQDDGDKSGGGGGGGGGGGSSGPAKPVIKFLYNEQSITGISAWVGRKITIPIEITDKNFYTNELTAEVIENENITTQAKFEIIEQKGKNIKAELSWTPQQEDVGKQRIFINANNGRYRSQKSLAVTVKSRTHTVKEKGGERERTCKFTDNDTQSVSDLCKLGIIDSPTKSQDYQGKEKNEQFFGDTFITRAEIMKIAFSVIDEPEYFESIAQELIKTDEYPFPDAEPTAWFTRYIKYGKDNGLIHGYKDGTIAPWRLVEKSEAYKILIEMAASKNEKIKNDLDQITSEIDPNSPWFMKYIELMKIYGVSIEIPEDVDPGIIFSGPMTRQEATDTIRILITNAGIETESRISDLKQELTQF